MKLHSEQQQFVFPCFFSLFTLSSLTPLSLTRTVFPLPLRLGESVREGRHVICEVKRGSFWHDTWHLYHVNTHAHTHTQNIHVAIQHPHCPLSSSLSYWHEHCVAVSPCLVVGRTDTACFLWSQWPGCGHPVCIWLMSFSVTDHSQRSDNALLGIFWSILNTIDVFVDYQWFMRFSLSLDIIWLFRIV